MRKNYLLTACVALLSMVSAATELQASTFSNSVFYGNLIATGDTQKYSSSVYSFPMIGDYAKTMVGKYFSFTMNGGATWVNEKIYGFGLTSYSSNFVGATYDADSQEWAKSPYAYPSTNGASDLAYDVVSGEIYGCFFGSDSMSGDGAPYFWGTVDKSTGNSTKIADMDRRIYVLAEDNYGIIYAIDAQGDLYKVNKSSGALTLVGSTGVTPKANTQQSGCFNPADNSLYWAAYTASGTSSLYRIEPGTTTAVKVYDFADNDRYAGLNIVAADLADNAPAAVNDLMVTNDGVSTKINVTFTAPTERIGGAAITGSVNYVVVMDGEEVDSGKLAAGAAYSKEIDTNSVDEHVIMVQTSNMSGDSPRAFYSLYVGPDTPDKVENVSLTNDGLHTYLTWSSPTNGKHGGVVDSSMMKYTIVRTHDDVVVSEKQETLAFDEEIITDSFIPVSYTITLWYGDEECGSVTSNIVLVGNPLTIPYAEDFEDATVVEDAGWSVEGGTWSIDKESDGNTYMKVVSDKTSSMYAFTPPLKLQAGHTYQLNLKFYSTYMWGNVFYVVLSSTQSVNTKIKQLVEVPRTYGTHNFSTESSAFPCTFEVDADGSYCIGLGSSVIQVFLGFDDIEVTDLSAVEVELPTVTTLNGSYTEDDGVLLTWKTPEYDEDQMTILGYNVWYNGEKITETPLQEKTYQNKMTVEEGDKFNVSVVYDLGESELSNDVIISVSGVNVAAQAAVKAYTSHGALLIDNPIGRRITVCNITGAAIYSSSQSGVTTITADKGVYLIMVDGKTTMRVVL